ncbi:MAG TPA: type I restriction endonuclease [Phormidium sp.]
MKATEYTLVEKPCIDTLENLGYTYLPPAQNKTARDSLNQVILKDIFIQSIQKINNIPQEVANATYQDIITITDNEELTNLLRGNYSRNIPGAATIKSPAIQTAFAKNTTA